ncbi:MAG: glycosyltransferase [Pyrinomonadaceae bacterium]
MKAYEIWRENGISGVRQQIEYRARYQRQRRTYRKWVKEYDTLTDADRKAILTRMDKLSFKPLISIIMPVYNVEEIWLRQAIESVRKQLYGHWELCIADDYSSRPHVRATLNEYAAQDSRIKVIFREENGHISAASNTALEMASGEFVALLDNDDELAEYALYSVIEEINAYPAADLIYSDDNLIDEYGARYAPNFKTDWNPDLFYSLNLVSHLGVYRRSLIEKIGGFRKGYEGSQDYDIALRVIEQIPEEHIRHIPCILYYWRAIHGSVALSADQKGYAHEAARAALRSHFERKKINATVTEGFKSFHRVVYGLPESLPLVSLIIIASNPVDSLYQTAKGIIEETDYRPLELLIVAKKQNGHFDGLEQLSRTENSVSVKVLRYDAPFNYSVMNNLAVQQSSAEIVGLISDRLKIISPGWLKEMVSHALRPEIGIVGGKIYYSDDSIRHAGIITGIGGVASNVYEHLPQRIANQIIAVNIAQNFSAVSAECMVMRKEIFNETGGLDAINLPLTYSDVDFCLRVRERGYRILWTPYAEFYYLEHSPRKRRISSQRLPHSKKESAYMKSRWGHLLSRDPYYNPNLTLDGEPFLPALPPRLHRTWESELA